MTSDKQILRVVRQAGQKVVADRCILAASAYSRLVGLLNHSRLDQGEGLMLEPCNQVHSFFMRFPIDAVFLSQDNTVLAISELRPWRMTKIHFRARKVLELPLGTSQRLQLAVGEKLEVLPC